ncbi:MAG: tRNA (adenosine(37)-N6)-dimethylallyltransferase MiaA [Patescibacteria group bacterium]
MLKLAKQIFHKISRPSLVVIAGPTASGKSSLAVEIALELARSGKGAEIISADSRQIYREIPIFSGAIDEEEQNNITHHLLGSESVQEEARTASWFREEADKLIREIHSRGGVPILVGGSGLWIQGVLCEDEYPDVAPNPELRALLDTYSIEELQAKLASMDDRRSQEVDSNNRRRLIRSIEIASVLGTVPVMGYTMRSEWEVQAIYCNYPKDVNDSRIRDNVALRVEAGMLEEAKQVYDMVDESRFKELGLAYKHLARYWEGELDIDELQDRIATEEIRYAKRQRTFFDKMFAQLPIKPYVITKRDERTPVINKILGHYRHS